MPNKSYSRRKFLGNVAAGSTGAALASLPAEYSASASIADAAPPYPLTMESYPLFEASGRLQVCERARGLTLRKQNPAQGVVRLGARR